MFSVMQESLTIDLSVRGKQDRAQMIMISGQETVGEFEFGLMGCSAQTITITMYNFFFVSTCLIYCSLLACLSKQLLICAIGKILSEP